MLSAFTYSFYCYLIPTGNIIKVLYQNHFTNHCHSHDYLLALQAGKIEL